MHSDYRCGIASSLCLPRECDLPPHFADFPFHCRHTLTFLSLTRLTHNLNAKYPIAIPHVATITPFPDNACVMVVPSLRQYAQFMLIARQPIPAAITTTIGKPNVISNHCPADLAQPLYSCPYSYLYRVIHAAVIVIGDCNRAITAS
jgi:hypothetical protein